ncbi:anti-sigma regulatory factor (Ser/Thr protein kinase) [Kitasatospora sp. MAP12-15]|uniref:ATP-binding protein n=1 Tax=unclassified Kitasatospora TaxID=2633591 RepID=UPI0024769573|nr:ATP-binding protein [Kitasatospora sp. MAP12-44]MDH6109044.1 anti-sigma regulatory factor (Ser/Thr protein kinase) [Kitasatospora sp. MAP12-44]
MSESQRKPLAPTLQESCWLPRSNRSPGIARQLLRELLARMQDGERFTEHGELVLSELVTNALVHGTRRGQLVRVSFEAGRDRLWIGVEDADNRAPRLSPAPQGESGRGLLLVDQLSADWGWAPRQGLGKQVWSVLAPAGGIPEQLPLSQSALQR